MENSSRELADLYGGHVLLILYVVLIFVMRPEHVGFLCLLVVCLVWTQHVELEHVSSSEDVQAGLA